MKQMNTATQQTLESIREAILSNAIQTSFVDGVEPGTFEISLSTIDRQVLSLLSQARLNLNLQSYAQYVTDLFFSKKSIDLGIKKSKSLTIKDKYFRPIPTAASILVEWTGGKYKVLCSNHNYWKNERLFHAEEMNLLKLKQTLGVKGEVVAYTSLEPCSSRLETKSCCQLLSETKIQRVVFPSWDSNPNQMFQSIPELKKSGVSAVFMTELELLAIKQNRHMPVSTLISSVKNRHFCNRKTIKRIISDAKYYWFGKN